MNDITKLIKAEIKRQYKNVRQFSKQSGIPYSTLANALTKGIGGTSYETVCKIFEMLDLQSLHNADAVLNWDVYEMCRMMAALDEHAVHTVRSVLNVEYDRCTNRAPAAAMATA